MTIAGMNLKEIAFKNVFSGMEMSMLMLMMMLVLMVMLTMLLKMQRCKSPSGTEVGQLRNQGK